MTHTILALDQGTTSSRAILFDRQGQVVMITLGFEAGSASKGCDLNFDRRGGQYFMRAVQCESAAISIRLPVSNLEKRIPVEVGKLHDSDGQVLVEAE